MRYRLALTQRARAKPVIERAMAFDARGSLAPYAATAVGCIEQAHQGRARTQSPTTRNYAVEIPTFGEFAEVSSIGVQWQSLALGEPPSWSWYLPCQVSMTCTPHTQGPHSRSYDDRWWCWQCIAMSSPEPHTIKALIIYRTLIYKRHFCSETEQNLFTFYLREMGTYLITSCCISIVKAKLTWPGCPLISNKRGKKPKWVHTRQR